jgi:hypothetical protein
MLYKHWKKILLALTGFFWAGCDDSASSEVCLYGPPPDYGISSESETVDESSSSAAAVTSSESANSSSSKQKDISSSSDGEEPQGIVDCYDVSSDRQTFRQEQNNGTTLLSCDNGVACQERVTAADVTAPNCEVTDCNNWVPPTVYDTVYYCINGENTDVYTPEEFKERYTKVDKDIESSSSSLDAPIAVYGSPVYFDQTNGEEKQ